MLGARVWLPPLLAVAVLAGCARPTGDFGRPRPNVIHDEILPALGREAATARKEPRDDRQLSAMQEALYRSAWPLLLPLDPTDKDGAARAEAWRVRLAANLNINDQQRYSSYLLSARFASAAGRYNRLQDDAETERVLQRRFTNQALKLLNNLETDARDNDLVITIENDEPGARTRMFIRRITQRMAERTRALGEAWRQLDARYPYKEGAKSGLQYGYSTRNPGPTFDDCRRRWHDSSASDQSALLQH